jgi:deoxyribonuclease-4
LDKAVERGAERGCQAIQIFNQSPRMWRPTAYGEADFAAFRHAMAASPLKAVLIHAVYLLNCASEDREIRDKSRRSLIHSLRVGDGIGAAGVVLHPGSAKQGDVGQAIRRAGKVIAEALAESESCPLHLEDTAGAGGTLGRSFEELSALIEAAGAGRRLGVCLDSCHLLASGYDIRSAEGLSVTLDRFDQVTGLDRLSSLHLNDSQTPLGSNRDRHANVGQGELGEKGCAAFLSEPRFQPLVCVLETQGPDRQGPSPQEVALCFKLRKRGQAARARSSPRRSAASARS